MELFTYKVKQSNDRFAIGCFGIVLLMLSPLIIGNIGTMLVKNSGSPCTEASGCFWSQVPTYAEYTVPLGGLLLLLYVPLWLMSNYDVVDEKDTDSVEETNYEHEEK